MDALADSQARILYLYGADSKYRAVADMNVMRFTTHRPPVEVVRFEGGVHDLHLQYPDIVAGLVLRFSEMAPGSDLVARGVSAPTDEGLVAQDVVR
jgi:pimeloyl-ACP methyl ester carboxylesterase